MKILYDGRIFQYQRAGGINRYFAELISRLPEAWTPVISGVREFGENAPTNKRLICRPAPSFRPHRLRQLVQERWWKPRLLRSVRLVHPTYYDLTDGLSFQDLRCPVVISVYDLIYVRFARQIEHSETVIKAQELAVSRADRIVCISRSTERDLLEAFPRSRGKTIVVPLASSFPRISSSAQTNATPVARIENVQFLFVGGRSGYKNFYFLLRAFAAAVSLNPSIRLIVAGAPLSNDEQVELHRLKLGNNVESIVYPSSVDLQQLYRRSTALLYPSLYEGFGFPPLEAMSSGTLAVASRTSSLPEVVGDGGLLLDPTDADQWTDCILRIASGLPERDALIARGLQQAAKFSWEDTVQQHLGVYSTLL